MAAGDVVLQADGAYVDAGDGRLVRINGIFSATPNNGAVIRVPPRNTTILSVRDNRRSFDMSDVVMMAIAISHGGLTYAELSAVRPAVATFLQNQGVVEGTSDSSTNSLQQSGGV